MAVNILAGAGKGDKKAVDILAGAGKGDKKAVDILAGLAKPKKRKTGGRGGILGTGIGPKTNLGVGTLLSEVAGGVTGLVRLVAPGSKAGEPGFRDAGKAVAGSALGTLATAAKVLQFPAEIATLGKTPNFLEGAIKGFGEATLGTRPQDFFEVTRDRGLLPALAETAGNVALAGAAVKGALRAGSAVTGSAALRGAAQSAALNVATHPYRAAGRGIRSGVTTPAGARLAESVAGAGNISRPSMGDLTARAQAAGIETTSGLTKTGRPKNIAHSKLWEAVDPEAHAAYVASRTGTGDAVSRSTRLLGKFEQKLQGQDAKRAFQEQSRQLQAERRAVRRSPGVVSAIDAAAEHLPGISRRAAEAIIDEEVIARLEGSKFLQDAAGLSDTALAAAGVRTRFTPPEFRTPEFSAALDDVAAQWSAAKKVDTERLLAGPQGSKGLETIDSPYPVVLSKTEARRLTKIEKFVESDEAAARIAKETLAKLRVIATQEESLGSLARRAGSVSEKSAAAFTAAIADPVRRAAAQGVGEVSAAGPGNPAGKAAGLQKAVDKKLGLQFPAQRKPATRSPMAEAKAVVKTLDKIEHLARRKAALEASATKAAEIRDAALEALGGTRTAALVDDLAAEATLLRDIRAGRRPASNVKVNAKWQPLNDAINKLTEAAGQSPELAAALSDVPKTLADIVARATAAGFDPTHVRLFSQQQVRSLVYENLRLGVDARNPLRQVAAGTRKSRAYLPAGKARSLDALAAATVEVASEARTNAVITFMESMSRVIPAGGEVPKGWKPLEPVRNFLYTGSHLTDDAIKAVPSDTRIIPDAVAKQAYKMSERYDHAVFRGIAAVTNPWRTLVLTLSPGWYVRNVFGNAIMATAEGVSLRDWHAAYKSWRAKDSTGRFADVPFISGSGIVDDLQSGKGSLFPRHGLRAAAQEAGLLGVLQEISRKAIGANEVVDEFSRAAVYHRGRRLNMSHEEAVSRSSTALVDYGNLSEFERKIVRSAIPFYSWQKGILKVVATQALDHPLRTNIMMQLGQMNEEYIADRFGVDPADVPEGYNHIIGSRNLRSFNPFADAGQLLTPEGIAASMNPILEIPLRKGIGAPEFFPEFNRLSPSGHALPDTDVVGEVTNLLAGVPGARLLGAANYKAEGAGTRVGKFLGVPVAVDDEVMRERLAKARKALRPEAASSSLNILAGTGR